MHRWRRPDERTGPNLRLLLSPSILRHGGVPNEWRTRHAQQRSPGRSPRMTIDTFPAMEEHTQTLPHEPHRQSLNATPPRAQHPPHAPVTHPGGPSVASFYFHLRFVDCLVSTSRYIGTSHTQLPPLTRHNARRARAHYSNQVYDHVLTTYLTQPVYR